MKRYEGRYCTFAVPDDWVAKPPFAFVGKDDAGGRWTAQVLERCVLEATPVAAHLQQQKAILPDLYEGFELLVEGPYRPEGVGEGFTFTFRFLDEDENDSLAQTLYLVFGPLACQLVLAGLDRPDRERDRLFAAIIKTFQLRKVEFLAKLQAAPFTTETLRTPQAVAAKGWPGPWKKFPRACVALPVPSGWDVKEEDGDVLFRRGAAEIRLHRDLEGYGDPGNWFASRMKSMQASGDLLLGSERGELERGPFVAVLYEERGTSRTWKTAAVPRSLDLYLSDRQQLLWSLKAPESEFPHQCSLFESLVAATEILDPSEWETKLLEPWVDYTLRGPWQAEGPGLYANTDELPSFILMSSEPTTLALEKLQPSIVESMRRGFPLGQDSVERSVTGSWKQHDAFYYGLDGREGISGAGISVRAVWLMEGRQLYNIFVRGRAATSAEPLSRALLEAFEPHPRSSSH